MTVKSLWTGVLAGMMCVSCGENQPAGGQGQSRGKTLAGAADTTKSGARNKGELRIPEAPLVRAPASADGAGAAESPRAAVTPGADLSDVPLAPKDAQWTIYCAAVKDPSHVETARSLKSTLVKRTGMREWYILHESNQSRLYYGFYRSINDKGDAAESSRAKADRKKIDELVDAGGERPFRACQFVQLSAPDPEAPPQWNVVNLPPDKVWTLVVGAYKDHPDRKRAAVEAVRAARELGEEAYYYHGESISNVCIGAWPEEALVEERVDPDPAAGKSGRGDLLVLPPGIKVPERVRDKTGKAWRPVSQQLVPVDATLQKKLAQYPEMGVNGEFITHNVRGKKTVEPSMVIAIPRSADTLFSENVAAEAAEQNEEGRGVEPQHPVGRGGYEETTASQVSPGQPAGTNNAGPRRLRSIGKQ